MRIVYVLERTDQLWGGVKVALTDANWLQAAGHDVTVVSRTVAPPWMELRCGFRQIPGLEPRSLPEAEIYIGTFWTTVPSAAAAAALRGAACVHFCQGYEGNAAEFAEHRHRIEQIYRLPGVHHVTISQHLTELLGQKFGIRAAEVPNAIDHDVHFPGTRDAARSRIRVGLVGPYEVPLKGIRTGIEACRLAEMAGQQIELVRVTNTGKSAAEGAQPFPVEWHQRKKPTEMGDIYRSLDVFLGTSNGVEEGFSLPAVEAMACGVPCVLTDIPCYRAHGNTSYALFVPADDAAAMAEALVLAARVPEIGDSLRAAGIAAAARYTQQAHGERLHEVLLGIAQQQHEPVRPTATRRDNLVAEPGRTTGTLRSITTAKAASPSAPPMLQSLRDEAERARERGQLDDTARLLAAAHCLDPRSGELAADAAWARHLAGDTTGALRLLDRCLQDGLDDAAVHERRAELQNGLGDTAAAAQSLRAAIAAGARNVDTYNRLGVALYRANDLDGARSSFERALLLDPGNRDAASNLQELPAA